MSTAITPLATNLPTPTELGTIGQMAKAIYSSGLFNHNIKSEAAAVTIILTCRELGIPPVYGCNNIHVIKGKPCLSAALMHALIMNRLGGAALRITETTADRCTVEYRRPEWETPDALTWTLAQATAAGLTTGADSNWKKFPAEMLRARALAAAARLVGPDILAGMYTPEELGAAVTITSEGEVTMAESTPEPEPPPVAAPEADPELDAARAALTDAMNARGWRLADLLGRATSVWPNIRTKDDLATLTAFQVTRLADVVTGESIIDANGRIMPRPEPATIAGPLLETMRQAV